MTHTDQILRSKLVKLAQTNPELRVHLIPLLRTTKMAAGNDLAALSKQMDKAMKGLPTNGGVGWVMEVIRGKLADGEMPSKKQVVQTIHNGKDWAEKYHRQNWGGVVEVLEKLLDKGLVKDASAKTSKLMSRQEAILKKYLEGGGNAMSFDDLPSSTVKALEAVKDQETLWSDVERWLGDNNNPHLKSKWATQQKVAHKAILFSEGLDKTAVRDGQAFMVYKVDPIDNNSKFYEGLIIEEDSNPGNPQSEVSGFRVLRRWGALTDSGQTGRIDGAKYDEMDDYWFPTLNGAKMELRKHYMKRLTNGYKSAFGDEHTTPDGHKLPMGEYPVGLTRKPGFGWGSQSITNCSPALHSLQEALANARKEIITTGKASAVQEDLMRAVQILKAVASADSTMAAKILKAVNLVLRRLSGSPRFLPDEDGKALSGNLKTIQTYVGKQLSLCGEG